MRLPTSSQQDGLDKRPPKMSASQPVEPANVSPFPAKDSLQM